MCGKVLSKFYLSRPQGVFLIPVGIRAPNHYGGNEAVRDDDLNGHKLPSVHL